MNERTKVMDAPQTHPPATWTELFGKALAQAKAGAAHTAGTARQDTHLNRMRHEIASRYGIEDPNTLRGRALELQALRDNGLLIAVHCHGTNLFTKRATWAELGIPESDERARMLTKGMKHLVPSEWVRKIKSLEARKRKNLDKHGVQVAAWPGFRWVPATVRDDAGHEIDDPAVQSAYEQWKETDEQINAELAELKADILSQLPSWRDERLPEVFGKAAQEAWTSIRARDPDFDESPETFSLRVIGAAAHQFPTADQVRYGLYFTHTTDFVMNPTDVARELSDRARIEAQADAEIAAIRAQAAAESARFHAERDIAEERRRTEISKLQAMRQAEAEHARQRLLEMGSPFQQVLDQYEAQLYDAVQHMIEAVNDHGVVRGSTKKHALNTIKQYRALSSLGGLRLHDEIRSLENALSTPGQSPTGSPLKSDPDAVRDALANLARQTREAAHRVSQDVVPTRAAFVEF